MTVLVTIVMWIIFYQNLTFTWSIFLSSIHIFLLIYIGKIIANKDYLFFYLNYVRAIFKYPQLHRATEETSFNETPIKSTIHDKYNRVATAQKLKDKLTGYDGKSFRRIALVGDFGTGKSSTLNMLEELINKEQYYKKGPNEKWLFVHFDAWGKANNSNDIQGQLLEEVIFNLSKTIETSSVRELPKQYLSAMKDVHISSKLFSNFLSGVFSAEQQLKDLNLLLIENNLRLCIFIEDMDRNHDVIKVTNSIAPLLDNFKSTNKISFIFALGYSDGATQIISRVTDYREDLPPIDFTEGIKILAFEQHKLANLKRVELFYEKTNSDWLLNKRCYRTLYGRKSVSTIKVIKMLNQLIASAREFEAIKREVISSWSLLIGEFNFDDLLILTTLKISCPLAYDFIHINIQSLQAADYKEDLLKSWDAIDFNQMTYKKDISFKLVSYLFPMLGSSSNKRPQSIAESSVKNYWNIYLNSSSKINIEFSDQVLFNQMKQFDDQVLEEGNIAFIDKMVGNPQFIEFVNFFII
ncbi:P-loop NTPase fold protein [Pseudoalteromonas sp. B131b]|uniref:P-loop NTPase fold protein n=1 Tax=Pseudoalteromonas sp. B131b TaxID=630493 RepID=UPI00301BB721